MFEAMDPIPVNHLMLGRGNTMSSEGLWEQLRAGAGGFKVHEDWGATPAAVHTADDLESFLRGLATTTGLVAASFAAAACRISTSFLRSQGVLPADRIRAVETGSCPHTAIRDDVTTNLLAIEDLEEEFAPLDIVFVESGGDNLTATFSPSLVDAQLFVLDIAGGGDVARKGGPGIERADLLVINKIDLAEHVDVDVDEMIADAENAREGRPVLATSRKIPETVGALRDWIRHLHDHFRTGTHVAVDPGPMAPHFHADDDGGHVHSHA